MKLSTYFVLFVLLVTYASAENIIFYDDFNRPDSVNVGEKWTTWKEAGNVYFTVLNNSLFFNDSNGGHNEVFLHSKTSQQNFTNVNRIDFQWKLDRKMQGKNFGQAFYFCGDIDTFCYGATKYFDCLSTADFAFRCRNASKELQPILYWNEFQPNKFYNVSIRNIDWIAGTSEIYIDDVPKLNYSHFNPGIPAQITLYNKGAVESGPYVGYWDEIFLYGEEEPQVNPLLLKYSPVIYLHQHEIYEPREIASLMNYSNLRKKSIVDPAPTFIEEISDLEESRKYSMDMYNVDIDDPSDMPLPEDFYNYAYKVYATNFTDRFGFTYLQYFMFFPFQDYGNMNHEGDWEMIQVILNSAMRLHTVSYFFHIFTETYYDMDLVDFVNNTHPKVLVAKGSHNTYGSDELYRFHKVIDLGEKMEFWFRFFRYIKRLDKINMDGIVLKPKSFPTDTNEFNYVLEQIEDSTPWVKYEGRWGQDTYRPLNKGPRFPIYSSRTNAFSPDPIATMPGPLIGVSLYSPVTFEIYDENNKIINESSEDIVIFNNESEFILIRDHRNATINLSAYEAGNFTLELYYYDNETNTGILPYYKNITITEISTGKIVVSIGSDFILYIDDDSDGMPNREILPDEIVTYNGFNYIFDFDNDWILNHLDNCPHQYNPEQLDFNDDNKGDACDNPRYYKNLSLTLLREIQPITKRDAVKINLVEKNILQSLDLEYWESNFSINSKKVFVKEMVATLNCRYANVSKLLVKADSLIVEKELLEQAGNQNYNRAKDFYEQGNWYYEGQKYNLAIINYMKAWSILHKP